MSEFQQFKDDNLRDLRNIVYSFIKFQVNSSRHVSPVFQMTLVVTQTVHFVGADNRATSLFVTGM